jgi:hypothetical protein
MEACSGGDVNLKDLKDLKGRDEDYGVGNEEVKSRLNIQIA